MIYVKCIRCQKPMRIEKDERDCIYCGYPLDGNSEKITEREWRAYWGTNILGQPYSYNKIKTSRETHLQEGHSEENGVKKEGENEKRREN